MNLEVGRKFKYSLSCVEVVEVEPGKWNVEVKVKSEVLVLV